MTVSPAHSSRHSRQPRQLLLWAQHESLEASENRLRRDRPENRRWLQPALEQFVAIAEGLGDEA
jgi:hypothetical protein